MTQTPTPQLIDPWSLIGGAKHQRWEEQAVDLLQRKFKTLSTWPTSVNRRFYSKREKNLWLNSMDPWFSPLSFFFFSCFDRFRALDPVRVDKDRLKARLSFEKIKGLPELRYNPFLDRLVDVFSTSEEDKSLSFEDFLDLSSALSENSPLQLKADWAFRVFGNFQWHMPSLSSSRWPTRDHMGTSTGISNSAWHLPKVLCQGLFRPQTTCSHPRPTLPARR